jgi:hypothetical protein
MHSKYQLQHVLAPECHVQGVLKQRNHNSSTPTKVRIMAIMTIHGKILRVWHRNTWIGVLDLCSVVVINTLNMVFRCRNM